MELKAAQSLIGKEAVRTVSTFAMVGIALR